MFNISIEVRVPEEIADYKESIIFGLSIRQMISGSIALLCSVPTFFLLKNINVDLATYAAMAVSIPAFCVGFIKKDGYHFEVFLKIKLYSLFGKKVRGYETADNMMPIEVEEFRQEIQDTIEREKQIALEQQLNPSNKNKKNEVRNGVGKGQKINAKRKTKRTAKREYDFIEVTEKSIKRKRKRAKKIRAV